MLFTHSNYSFPQEEVDSLVQEVDSIAQSEALESVDDIVEEQLVVEEEELNFHQELKKRFIEGGPGFIGNSFTVFNSRFSYCYRTNYLPKPVYF